MTMRKTKVNPEDEVTLGKMTPKPDTQTYQGNFFDVVSSLVTLSIWSKNKLQFRDADYRDYFLVIGGLVLSAANGALVPFNSLVFEGELTSFQTSKH